MAYEDIYMFICTTFSNAMANGFKKPYGLIMKMRTALSIAGDILRDSFI